MMSEARKLLCQAAGVPPSLAVAPMAPPVPAKGAVVVRVAASSVNPIDVKRASGYGRRLLGLKGAARFPLVLGNDFAGVVESVGPGVAEWRPGDQVFGVLPTGKGGGAHATHVSAAAGLMRPAPQASPPAALAVLPYTFTTLWLALRQAGVTPDVARGLRVVVHGASGGLGLLALQLLNRWGAIVTAICSAANSEVCRSSGAASIWDRTAQRLEDLPATFDAGLNFGAWQDEEVLVGKLRQGALGYATAVHPLLGNFDRYGWVGGLWRTRSDKLRMQALARSKGAAYGWTIFRPDGEALDMLVNQLNGPAPLKLPIGIAAPLTAAADAFAHVAQQRRGRAVLECE